MPLHKCPRPEKLLEFLSIRKELSFWERIPTQRHLRKCQKCRDRIETIQTQLDSYYTPETDITSSLVQVYSRLQEDETLILKGWKLRNLTSKPRTREVGSFVHSWVFRGAAIGAMIAVLLLRQSPTPDPIAIAADDSAVPLAQIRFEEQGRTRVQYVKPELIRSVEFQTMSLR